jgi:hypothetical protein
MTGMMVAVRPAVKKTRKVTLFNAAPLGLIQKLLPLCYQLVVLMGQLHANELNEVVYRRYPNSNIQHNLMIKYLN